MVYVIEYYILLNQNKQYIHLFIYQNTKGNSVTELVTSNRTSL